MHVTELKLTKQNLYLCAHYPSCYIHIHNKPCLLKKKKKGGETEREREREREREIDQQLHQQLALSVGL